MYVVALVIVAAIVNWLVDTAAASLVNAFVVPPLQRARRESTSVTSSADYERGLAAASFARAALTSAAVYATCSYYAANNAPVWPAWVVFGVFFAGLQLPRLVTASACVAGLRRSAA